MMRDRRTVVMSVVIPAGLLLLFGFAVSFDVREIRLAVWDKDESAASRELTRAFVASGFFRDVARVASEADVSRALDDGTASAVLVIPRGFARDLARAVPARVQIIIDGADSARASIMQGQARQITQTFTAQRLTARLRESGVTMNGTAGDLLPIDFQPRVLYNPELRSRNFMVPGLIGVLLTILGVLQTSLAIAREKDLGTMDQMRVTPLRPWEIVLGKILPYALVAFANAWIALGVGHFLMGVPVRGSLWVFLLGTVLFLVSALGIGLTISAVTKTQQGAQTAAFLGSVLPVFYLSDFMFPIRSMPAALQVVTWFNPARYYVAILRGTLLKGSGVAELAGALSALGLFAVGIGLLGLRATRRAYR